MREPALMILFTTMLFSLFFFSILFIPSVQAHGINVGYEFLNGDTVLHFWNTVNDYYLNRSSSVQWSNHYQDYWTHNIFCIGYYSEDNWNKAWCADELKDFNEIIDSDNATYINVTYWRDFTYAGYSLRAAVNYYLGINDTELSVTPYIKNKGAASISQILGFAWRADKIKIGGDEENDYVEINNAVYNLHDSLDLTFKNMTRTDYYDNCTMDDICYTDCLVQNNADECYNLCMNCHPYTIERKIPAYKLGDKNGTHASLRWDESLNYLVRINSNVQYNAPIDLGIKIGSLSSGQEKYTTLYWSDQVAYTVCSSGCDYTTIQAGINAASAGDTVLITDSSIYNENVVLNKSITLTSNSTVRPGINATAGYAIRITANNAVVSNLTIAYNGTTTSQYVVYVNPANGTTIMNNTIKSTISTATTCHGIYISNSQNNTILGNTIFTTAGSSNGIYITGTTSRNNSIRGNNVTTASYSAQGIYVTAINNTIDGNNVTMPISPTSSYGIYIGANNITVTNNNITTYGGYLPLYVDAGYNTVVIGDNNYVNGLPIAYNMSLYNMTMTVTTYGELIVAGGRNVTVINSNFSVAGILFVNTTNSTIADSNMTTKNTGIMLAGTSQYNTIMGNNVTTTASNAVCIWVNSGNYNNITNNTVRSTSSSGVGIQLYSNYNNISSNIIKTVSTSAHGIYMTSNGNNVALVNITTAGTSSAGIRMNGNNSLITFSNITTTGATAWVADNTSSSPQIPAAVWIRGGDNNRISDCNLNATNYYTVFVSGIANQINYLINDTLNKTTGIYFNASSTSDLYVQWYLDVYVNDTSGNAINGATVIGNQTNTSIYKDNPATNNFTATTNTSGYIPTQTLSEFLTNWTYNYTQGYLYFTNYTLNTSAAGYFNDSRQINLTSSRTVIIILSTTATFIDIYGITNGTYPLSNIIYCSGSTSCSLWRNGTNVTSENNTAIILGAGLYNYTASINSPNQTTIWCDIAKYVTVTRLYLNGTEADKTYNISDIANITAEAGADILFVTIYANYTGELANITPPTLAATTNYTNIVNLPFGAVLANTFMLFANTTRNENYTASEVNYTLTKTYLKTPKTPNMVQHVSMPFWAVPFVFMSVIALQGTKLRKREE